MILNDPMIVKETSSGLEQCHICDKMLQHREIDCVGEINIELVNSVIQQLRYLEKEDPNKEIIMYINSLGGNVHEGMALYDAMQMTRCPIKTVCVGVAASMGAVLFASGAQRVIYPHARVMIHDPLIAGNLSGTALKIDQTAKDLMQMREMLAQILAQHTGQKISVIYKKTSVDSYFTADEAVKFGLADCVAKEL